jgi:hypothetical protein
VTAGLQALIKSLRIFADEADTIRARAARLGIHISLVADKIEKASLEEQSAAPGEKSERNTP